MEGRGGKERVGEKKERDKPGEMEGRRKRVSWVGLEGWSRAAAAAS